MTTHFINSLSSELRSILFYRPDQGYQSRPISDCNLHHPKDQARSSDLACKGKSGKWGQNPEAKHQVKLDHRSYSERHQETAIVDFIIFFPPVWPISLNGSVLNSSRSIYKIQLSTQHSGHVLSDKSKTWKQHNDPTQPQTTRKSPGQICVSSRRKQTRQSNKSRKGQQPNNNTHKLIGSATPTVEKNPL